MRLSKFMPLMAVLFLAACGTREPLEVWPFHLRDLDENFDSDPMIVAEHGRRLHGAVGVREREQRLGHYYTVYWEDPAAGGGAVEVVLEYQQGATGSKVLKQTREFPADQESGKAEFQVVGNDYLEGGRVLTWKCTLRRGRREVATKQSYLWR